MGKRVPTMALLENFDEDAKYWGLQEEWGTGIHVKAAEKDYKKSKAALIRRIKQMEKDLLKKDETIAELGREIMESR